MSEPEKQFNPDLVIQQHQSLVEYYAKKYCKYGLSIDDLRQEGMLGLLEACKRFDSGKNVSFETYAGHWVKKYILQALNLETRHSFKAISLKDNDSIARPQQTDATGKSSLQLPVDMPLAEQMIVRLSFEQGKTLKEISTELNLTMEKVRQLREKALRRIKQLNTYSS